MASRVKKRSLETNRIYCGDARELLPQIERESVSLSVWSPPYFVGKSYESYLKSYEAWQDLIRETIQLHFAVLKPGGFVVINIADILCFPDPSMPRIPAENVSHKRSPVTREDVLKARQQHPGYNRYQLAELLGCSEQTIDRRLNGNNIRGGKYSCQTRIQLVAGRIAEWAGAAGLYLYDRRTWVKDPCWQNSEWHTTSYRSVDESEYLYFLWKPGTTIVDRSRLCPREWAEWGSRGVWFFPSVRANDVHEARFPAELPRRVIKLLTAPGETVLDCFVGSGTSAVAAIHLGRKFIGIDLVPRYAALAKKACDAASHATQTGSRDRLGYLEPARLLFS